MLARARQRAAATRDAISRRPYLSLSIFVIVVALTSVATYARYQHVQAELEAQQDMRYRIQQGFDNWSDDLAMRFGDFTDSVQGTTQGAANVVGGAWGIISYLVTAVLDFLGNLHIMIPVCIIYFGVGFFGTLKMRVATLIGAIIGVWVSTSVGIVQGSVIGLLAIAGLLFWNKIDPRLLTAIQSLPSRLKAKLKQTRDRSDQRHSSEFVSTDEAADSHD